jgi:3-keto-disaccharide hydrolase
MKSYLALLVTFLAVSVLAAADNGFVPLFNGHDLTGWTNVNCAPETWSVKDGMIHCTGLPTGALRTVRQYENFILELEWRHLRSGGNSGVFIWGTPIAAPGVPFLRAIEVQVLDHGFNVPGKNEWYTTHGDVFPIHGSTMKPFGRHNGMRSFPSEERSKGTPEWNHYRIVCSNGVIRLQVNGKQVSGGEDCDYRKGYLGLESEGAPIDFRNLRIVELPGSGAPPALTAPAESNWHSLFTGLDLRGWRTNSATVARWRVEGERLVLRPGNEEAILWTDTEFGDANFIVDCRSATLESPARVFFSAGSAGGSVALKLEGAKPATYQRFHISVRGREVAVTTDGRPMQHLTLEPSLARRSLGLSDSGAGAEFMNIYTAEP